MFSEFDPAVRAVLVAERLERLRADAAPRPGAVRVRLGLALVALGERLARPQRVAAPPVCEPLA